MASLAELRKKIRGITSTRKITKAMKMVAGAKFARAARQRTDALYYGAQIEAVLTELLATAPRPSGALGRLVSAPGSTLPEGRIGLVVISADKGLCGDFNNSIMRKADAYVKEHGARLHALFAIGRKSVDHFKKSAVARRITRPQFFSKFDFSVAESLGQEALAVFTEEKITELVVIHGTFKSMVKQEVAQTRLLPVTPAGPVAAAGLCSNALLEPADETEMLKTLLPLHVKAKFYGMLRDTFTAFLASQMRAMDNATRNAGDLISSITLEMNKVRQAVITREIAEIISTSEVVK